MSSEINILFLWGNYDKMDVARNDILIPTFGIDVAGKQDSCHLIFGTDVASKHDPYHLTGSREWHGNCRCRRYVSRCITPKWARAYIGMIAGYVTDWARAHNVIKHA